MEVVLLACTPEPIRVLWTAARTCYSPSVPQLLWRDYPGSEKAVKLLRSLWERGHQSVFEHVALTYAISGVSRVLLAQYSRHRIGVSLSVQSQRHVRYVGEIIWPNNLLTAGAATTAVMEAWIKAHKAYDALVQAGIPKEDARFILPEGTATNFITTANLRSLMHLYRLRVLEPGAQWEIRELVREMVRLAAEKAIPELVQIIPEVAEIVST